VLGCGVLLLLSLFGFYVLTRMATAIAITIYESVAMIL
jgi:hypothetical protein